MKSLIVANWKANPASLNEACDIFNFVQNGISGVKNAEVVICPPFIYLPAMCSKCSDTLKFGAQDCFWEEGGAYTGEISAAMLKDLCAEYVILGHLERRIFLKETDKMINKKIKFVLRQGLKAILAVGGKTRNLKEIAGQLKRGLSGLKKTGFNHSNLAITYEPLFAISTMGGKALSLEEAMVGVLSIRKNLKLIFGREISQKIRILYGGSVNAENSKNFILKSQAQGLLIEKASLDKEEFVKIVKNVAEI